ncbi:dipeptidase [Candidatus Palauibacter sp.]|uniref:dipeptidase n=1 Tax=Candidatus Palauibacter sp. TaxID=3101350 RepID=UPI003AF2B998
MSDFSAYIDRELSRFHDELETFLRIPSISTDPERAGDVRACAKWVAEHLGAAGIPGAEVIETAGHPIVVGERMRSEDAPTVLVYGHYDVQPSEPDELWSSPPFEPAVRDGRLYARGAVDDKGQVHMHIKALETRLETGAGVPVNLKLVIEGEEEVGSRHLAAFLHEHAERLACDAILISDTAMFSPELPCITTGLRGIVYTEINVFGPTSDLHSGSYGGAVVNPANALAAIIAGLRDDRGRATVPGFYDAVRPISARERADLERLPMDEETLREGVGASALGGEAGFSALERLWYRPTLDVNGLLSGFTGEGSKTVLPSRAMAKVSMRLVPDQDPAQVIEAFEARVHELAPEGVTVEIKRSHGGAPWIAHTEHPIFNAASAALESGFGTPPAFVREGGSIPIVQEFEETFRAPALLVGFALPGCNAHAPDEWIDLGVYRKGIAALADLYGRLADQLT